MFSRGPQLTIGQTLAAERKNLLDTRANNFKTYVVPAFIKDIHIKINADLIKNPKKLVFSYAIWDIFAQKTTNTKIAFLSAIGGAEPIPFPEEINELATAFVESTKGQDFEAWFGEVDKTINIDITNVEILAAKRIAEAETIRKQKEEEVAKTTAIRSVADKIAAGVSVTEKSPTESK